MPIYEFYCPDCHTVYNFLARSADLAKRPSCPRCGRPALERRPSLFAISKRRPAGAESVEGEPPLDDPRLESAIESMAGELDGVDENDPRGAARLMRRLYDTAGLAMGPGLTEALRRLESGEDPDAIDAELGPALEAEEPFGGGLAEGVRGVRRRAVAPRTDPELYEL